MPSPLAADQTQTSALGAQNAPPAPAQKNFQDANKAMQLTPQEQNLYQMHLGNLIGPGGVDNPDGTRSTLLQTTVELDGRTYTLPTVWGGSVLSIDDAVTMAQRYGLEHFPNYANEQEAQRRYDQLHGYMEKDTVEYQRGGR